MVEVTRAWTSCLLAVLPWALACGPSLPPSAPGVDLGGPASVSLPSDGGALVEVPLPGVRATVVEAWAPSCGPCREKLPQLVSRLAPLEAEGVRLVLVASLAESESSSEARATLGSWGVARPFLIDRDGVTLARTFGIASLPGVAVVDSRGALRWVGGPTATADEVVSAARVIARD